MSNFNQYFKNTGAQLIVDKFFSGIDLYSDKKLTELTWDIEDEDNSPSYYIENGLTATFKVVLSYTVDWDGVVRRSEFEVPKEVDGSFIIDGAYRIATNQLGNDKECRIYMSSTGRHAIGFDYDRDYDIAKGVLIVRRTDPNLGLPEKVREYTLDDIDKISGLEREALRLTDRQVKKLQIKLDLPYEPEYITSQLIRDCIAYGDDRIKDLIIDKRIESVPQGFQDYLLFGSNRRNLFGTRRNIADYWKKQGKLQDQVNVLTRLCIRHWKGSSSASKGGQDVQISGGINAINMQSTASKIQVPESVAYNQSFSDLICIGDSPINQNVGKQNALTVSTHITDTDVLFDVYDLEFTKITISYLDYLNKKVCASEYVDYETNTLKPNGQGEVEVKYRLKRKMVPVSEVELVDLHPDYRLSETVRRIPFLNYTDSVRVMMGSSMLKQSIPLVNAERPLVDTGNYEELKNNTLNDCFKEDNGVIKEITEDSVVISLPDGEETIIPRRTSIKSIHDVNVFTEPKVKVGQKVKRGDVITGAVGMEKDTYKSGLNALVLFHAMFGLVNEDALVVSESFAEKMKSYSLIDLSYDIKSNSALKSILPIGSIVTKGDKLLTAMSAKHLDEINRQLVDKLGGIFGGDLMDLTEYTMEDSLVVPNNIFEAVVADVMVQENKHPKMSGSQKLPDLTFSHTSKKIIDSYDYDRKEIYEKYPEYIAADRLKPIDMNKKTFKVVYTVRIRLIMKTKLMKGSKLTNRYGGKGVISKILPDNQMPVMVDSLGKKKTVEVVMNPYSTINRKIPGVNMENLLATCAVKIHDLVDEWKEDEKDRKKILPLVQRYYPKRFEGMTLDEFLDFHERNKLEDVYYFNVGSYSKLTPEELDVWAKDLGVTPQSQILLPVNTVSDLEELKSNLPEDEYKEIVKDMEGKYVPADRPLSVGYMTMIELYHIPIYSNKVTSSMFGVDINEWKDDPIMGSGKYRKTGQKIGEMELNALLARGVDKFIESARGETSKEDNQMFLNNLLGLGITITDRKGYNQGGSDLKDRLGEMKIKYRRKK